MKLGISYWSVEGGLANTRPIEEAMKEAKAAIASTARRRMRFSRDI